MSDLDVSKNEGESRIHFEKFTPTEKDLGIKVHSKAIAALKDWFAQMGFGSGTFVLPDKNNYEWNTNTKSAINWISKYDPNFRKEIEKELKVDKQEANKRIIEKIETIVHSLVGKSDKELKNEAGNNNKEAQFILGDRLVRKRDKPEEGNQWILVAARNGHPHAQVRCGAEAETDYHFKKGDEAKKAYTEAINWYMLAANSYDKQEKAPHYIRRAEEKLALYFDPEIEHSDPEIPGLERSEKIALTYYLNAYKNGSYDEQVIKGLAHYYRNGLGGLKKDSTTADKLLSELETKSV